MRLVTSLFAWTLLGCATTALAHPGGLDANGGHHDRKRGGYHLHRPTAAPAVTRTPVGRLLNLPSVGRSRYRTEAPTEVRRDPPRPKPTAPPDLLPLIRRIEELLAGHETDEEQSDAARKLDEIATTYEGTPEAAEALRLLREIRAEEEQERREREAAATEEERAAKRENDAASKLRLAKVFIDSRKPSHARRWLEDLTRSYPETKSAAQAGEILRGL